jgi:tRNA threonylcarbamoyladenosine biosynthesis protein TsaB
VKILALETTERIGTLAAAEDADVLLELSLDPRLRSAQTLAPALVQLLERVGWRPADVQLVAVSIGPGSFTGVRVGVTAAKTFAYSAGSEILGIDTLEVIAAGVPGDYDCVAVAVDAQRGDVAAALFHRRPNGQLECEQPMRVLRAETWLASLPKGTSVAAPSGVRLDAPASDKGGERLDAPNGLTGRVPPSLTLVPPEFCHPTAAAVARLAARDYAAGRRDDLWQLVPRYSRPSAAEEKLS